MKGLILVGVMAVLFAGPAGIGMAQRQGEPVVVSGIDQGTELAKSFSRAFQAIQQVPVTLLLQHRDGERKTIQDVRKVAAQGAVLIVTDGAGAIYVVNPRDVVWITDRPQGNGK